jgi:hypothetical protein
MSTIKDQTLLGPTWTVSWVDANSNAGLARHDTFRVTSSGKIERLGGRTPVEWAHSCVVQDDVLTGLRSSDGRPIRVHHESEAGRLTCYFADQPIHKGTSSAVWVADDGRGGNIKLPPPRDLEAVAA